MSENEKSYRSIDISDFDIDSIDFEEIARSLKSYFDSIEQVQEIRLKHFDEQTQHFTENDFWNVDSKQLLKNLKDPVDEDTDLSDRSEIVSLHTHYDYHSRYFEYLCAFEEYRYDRLKDQFVEVSDDLNLDFELHNIMSYSFMFSQKLGIAVKDDVLYSLNESYGQGETYFNLIDLRDHVSTLVKNGVFEASDEEIDRFVKSLSDYYFKNQHKLNFNEVEQH